MPANADLRDLFCYGTLELPEVMRSVAGREFPALEARLPGYFRGMLQGAPYPGVVPRSGHVTPGTLYQGLDPRALARVDRYEGPEYRREALTVELADGSRRRAWVYVLKPSLRHRLTDAPWDQERFARGRLRSFLAGRGP
jgi:gamma-glutamylcyclotransferase (GGCT)/AIG2-like uncharacterized protein YtfP